MIGIIIRFFTKLKACFSKRRLLKAIDTSQSFIDISTWNATAPAVFDFNKAKAKGATGVYMRATFGLNVDSKYAINQQNCNLDYAGAYHYFDYRSSGLAQFNKFLSVVGKSGNLRGVLDIEDNSGSGWPRLDSMYSYAMKEALVWVNAYKQTFGHAPVMYLNSGLCKQKDWIGQYMFRNFLDCPLWVAHYTTLPAPSTGAWSGAALWQYTSTGDGLAYGNSSGNIYIDLNRVYDLQALLKTSVAPPNTVIIPNMSVTAFSQKGVWGNDKLGTSTKTIGSDGCLITDVAAVCNYFGKVTNPGQLNKDLIRVKGYENLNLLTYAKVTEIYPDIIVDWTNFLSGTAVTDEKIDAVLLSKRPVIAQVDYNPGTTTLEQHWVLIIGKDSSGYVIIDPIDGVTVSLKSRYSKVLRTVVYSQTSAPVVISDAEKLNRLWLAHPELHA